MRPKKCIKTIILYFGCTYTTTNLGQIILECEPKRPKNETLNTNVALTHLKFGSNQTKFYGSELKIKGADQKNNKKSTVFILILHLYNTFGSRFYDKMKPN